MEEQSEKWNFTGNDNVTEGRLHTFTAAPRSTQLSTLRGMVKWLSAFGLSINNKWQWWVWLLAAYRRTHTPGRLAWSEGQRRLAPFHIHYTNRVNSRSGFELRWQHHKHCRYYCYNYYYNGTRYVRGYSQECWFRHTKHTEDSRTAK